MVNSVKIILRTFMAFFNHHIRQQDQIIKSLFWLGNYLFRTAMNCR